MVPWLRNLRPWILATAAFLYVTLFPLRLRVDRGIVRQLPKGFREGVLCLLNDKFPDRSFSPSEDPNAIEVGKVKISLVSLLSEIRHSRLDQEQAKNEVVHAFQEMLEQACVQ